MSISIRSAFAVGVNHPGLSACTLLCHSSVPRSKHRLVPFHHTSPIHTSSKNSYHPKVHLHPASPSLAAAPPAPKAPLSLLPLHMILRTLLTTTISSSRWLLPPSLAIASALAHTTNPLLSPDHNPLLRVLLKHTFYAQFCAGETPAEVRQTVARLKGLGFSGVILGYAREVVLTEAQAKGLAAGEAGAHSDEEEVGPWREGTVQTVKLAEAGDFVALKFTGAGQHALYSLAERLPPSPALASAIDSICASAAERGVRLLFDAEQAAVQSGIDDWTLAYQRKYNIVPGKAVIYGTYQAYLKSTPATLTRHLLAAEAQGFTLGVKLVRGAYLGSDPRSLINDKKDETDAAYDDIVDGMLRQRWGTRLQGGQVQFPPASLVVASHNAESVRRARAVCDAGDARIEVAFGQLQGMADEVSCALVAAGREREAEEASSGRASALKAYKYLVWGSTGECMKYLLRRAHENRDAVQRTRTGRDAMWEEVVRRLKSSLGWAV
ncbi:hypothetical protein ACHAQA_004791 [Verticillium albo-atrum]